MGDRFTRKSQQTIQDLIGEKIFLLNQKMFLLRITENNKYYV